jgi:tRNA (cmo5U34)-methyltransferase
VAKDKVFSKDINKKFEFDEAVASVFDDMLSRSVPFYKEVQELIIRFINLNVKDASRVIDLGCSTAKFLLELNAKNKANLELIGVDNSKPMIEQASKMCKAFGANNIKLIYGDFNDIKLEDFDFVVSSYTLQFIRPIKRPSLVKRIYNGLNDGGIFIFSEKVVFEDKKLDKDIIDIYYDYKKEQGYSEYEIAKKREALENVLIPFTIEENIAMCKDAGFKSVDTLFQWGNFVTFIAKR